MKWRGRPTSSNIVDLRGAPKKKSSWEDDLRKLEGTMRKRSVNMNIKRASELEAEIAAKNRAKATRAKKPVR